MNKAIEGINTTQLCVLMYSMLDANPWIKSSSDILENFCRLYSNFDYEEKETIKPVKEKHVLDYDRITHFIPTNMNLTYSKNNMNKICYYFHLAWLHFKR